MPARGEANDWRSTRAHSIVRHPAFGVSLTKRVMRANLDAPSLAHAVLTENHTQVMCTTTTGFVEGVAALIGAAGRNARGDLPAT